MDEITVFTSADFGEVRTVTKDGEPWFVTADVCKALEIGNPSQALTRLDADEKFTTLISNEGAVSGQSPMSFINEPGLYALVLGSRKPEAKAFKRWITHEVIPTIRKHGAYATGETINRIIGDPDFGIKLLGQLKQEREARMALQAKTEQDAPKVLFAQSVECSKSEILIGDLAKILKQNGMDVGQKRLFEMLRRDGYLIAQKGASRNMPTQKSMDLGVMRIKESSITHADGHVTVNRTPKITGKGQVYFVNRYLKTSGCLQPDGFKEDAIH